MQCVVAFRVYTDIRVNLDSIPFYFVVLDINAIKIPKYNSIKSMKQGVVLFNFDSQTLDFDKIDVYC